MSNLAHQVRGLETAYHRSTLTLYKLNPPHRGYEYVIACTVDMTGMFTREERTNAFGDLEPLTVQLFPSNPDAGMAGQPFHEVKGTLSHDNAFAGIGYHIAGRSFGG